jgi:hypothetical protein
MVELQECVISKIYSALKRLCVVASSFPCERMFSKQDRLFVKRMMK